MAPGRTAAPQTRVLRGLAVAIAVLGGQILAVVGVDAAPSYDGPREGGGGSSPAAENLVPEAAEAAVDPSYANPDANDRVVAVSLDADGKAVIGGFFNSVGGSTRQGAARLNANGTHDTSFANPVVAGNVFAVTHDADGQVLIGGAFTSVGGESRQQLARLDDDGTLDATFVDPEITNSAGYPDVYAIAVQDDGKILVGGYFTTVDGESRQRVARLNEDGTLDPTFVDPQVNGQVTSIVLEDDGQIVIGGAFTTVAGESRQRVARLDDDGTLDATFADPVVADTVQSVAVQGDGKVVIGGYFSAVNGSARHGAARLNADGSLDTSFVDPAAAAVFDVQLADGGKVVIGGSFGSVGGRNRHGVARLNSDGTLDTTLLDPGANSWVESVAVQGDGQIIAGGAFTEMNFLPYSSVARLLAVSTPFAGTLDLAFHTDGRVESNLTAGDDYARAVVLQPDDRIVVAGEAGGQGGRFMVARYLENGTLDPSFSGNGWTATNFSSGWDEAMDLELLADGRIMVVGYLDTGRIGLARYLGNGAPDPSFSGDGKLISDFGPGFDWATSVELQADGKIVIAGETGGAGGQFMVARYHANGALDRSFSANGWAATNISSGEDWAWDLTLQADGKIVAAGLGHGLPRPTMALVRYRANGSLDPTFGGDGRVAPNLGPRPESAKAVLVQPDGKILIGGEYGENQHGDLGRGPAHGDGAFDRSFSGNGWATSDFSNGHDFAWDIALQPDGRVVLGGVSAAGTGEFGLLRFRANGSPDRTLGGDGWARFNFTSQFDAATGVAVQDDGKIVLVGGSGGTPGRVALARVHG